MNRAIFGVGLLVATLSWFDLAGEPSGQSVHEERTKENRATQDLLFLSDSGPVLLRFHVQIAGKP